MGDLMIVNGYALMGQAPIKGMIGTKERYHGVSYGLGEAGYDIRIKQTIEFRNGFDGPHVHIDGVSCPGSFTLASAIEEFQMPDHLVGIVHDKSTWARKGLSVFNTVIEPGFCGGLTLELVYHGVGNLIIPAGAGIAQVIFSEVYEPARYAGKYQGQSTDPVNAIFE